MSEFRKNKIQKQTERQAWFCMGYLVMSILLIGLIETI